jgi:1-acyl-sn-glycerol-3-phosphate acyltransferase
MIHLRSVLFYLGYAAVTVVWGTLSVVVGWVLPHRARFQFIIGAWTRMVLWWLKVTCGIRHTIIGLEHLPVEPCVVLCRHESTWETLFLQTLLAPQSTIIKRELLWIPFFGWAFALNKPIAINRSHPRSALRRLITVGKARLAEKIWVVLFPEGTRMPSREIGRFQVGGATLAADADVPLLVIAHDAGSYWPAHQLEKVPGTIRVKIAPPIRPNGRDGKTLTDEARRLMGETLESLMGPADPITRPD